MERSRFGLGTLSAAAVIGVLVLAVQGYAFSAPGFFLLRSNASHKQEFVQKSGAAVLIEGVIRFSNSQVLNEQLLISGNEVWIKIVENSKVLVQRSAGLSSFGYQLFFDTKAENLFSNLKQNGFALLTEQELFEASLNNSTSEESESEEGQVLGEARGLASLIAPPPSIKPHFENHTSVTLNSEGQPLTRLQAGAVNAGEAALPFRVDFVRLVTDSGEHFRAVQAQLPLVQGSQAEMVDFAARYSKITTQPNEVQSPFPQSVEISRDGQLWATYHVLSIRSVSDPANFKKTLRLDLDSELLASYLSIMR